MKHMKMKFNSDGELRLSKIIKIPSMTVDSNV